MREMIYPPREDTYLLLGELKKLVKPGMDVLDMGTGTGILGKAAMELGANVLGVDINPEAVESAKKLGIPAVKSDLFENLDTKRKFDIIVFNPPYLELEEWERQGEPIELALHGGKKGREVLDRFLDGCSGYLKPRGIVLFLQLESNGIRETEKKLNENGFKFRILKKAWSGFEGNLLVFLAWKE